jgi:hypothetical protein
MATPPPDWPQLFHVKHHRRSTTAPDAPLPLGANSRRPIDLCPPRQPPGPPQLFVPTKQISHEARPHPHPLRRTLAGGLGATIVVSGSVALVGPVEAAGHPGHGHHADRPVGDRWAAASIRRATARYRDVGRALADGYVPTDESVELRRAHTTRTPPADPCEPSHDIDLDRPTSHRPMKNPGAETPQTHHPPARH